MVVELSDSSHSTWISGPSTTIDLPVPGGITGCLSCSPESLSPVLVLVRLYVVSSRTVETSEVLGLLHLICPVIGRGIGMRGWGHPTYVRLLAWSSWFSSGSFKVHCLGIHYHAKELDLSEWEVIYCYWLWTLGSQGGTTSCEYALWASWQQLPWWVYHPCTLPGEYPLISASLWLAWGFWWTPWGLYTVWRREIWIRLSSFLGWKGECDNVEVQLEPWRRHLWGLLWPFNHSSVGGPWLCVGLPPWNTLISHILFRDLRSLIPILLWYHKNIWVIPLCCDWDFLYCLLLDKSLEFPLRMPTLWLVGEVYKIVTLDLE